MLLHTLSPPPSESFLIWPLLLWVLQRINSGCYKEDRDRVFHSLPSSHMTPKLDTALSHWIYLDLFGFISLNWRLYFHSLPLLCSHNVILTWLQQKSESPAIAIKRIGCPPCSPFQNVNLICSNHWIYLLNVKITFPLVSKHLSSHMTPKLVWVTRNCKLYLSQTLNLFVFFLQRLYFHSLPSPLRTETREVTIDQTGLCHQQMQNILVKIVGSRHIEFVLSSKWELQREHVCWFAPTKFWVVNAFWELP